MNRDVSEINMQQSRAVFGKDADDLRRFGGRHLPRRIPNASKPKAPQKMHRGFWDHDDRLKRKSFRFLALLRDDERPETLERRDLPVDVEHLRLQERRAITSDDRRRYVRHA